MTIAGVLYLAARISRNDALKSHVDDVIAKRREKAPSLLPDSFFKSVEDMDGVEVGVATEESEALQVLADNEALLFKTSEVELNRLSPAPSSGSASGKYPSHVLCV